MVSEVSSQFAARPMYPGGSAIGEEEALAAIDVVRSGRLFRYYGPAGTESAVAEFEVAVAQTLHVDHSLAVNSGTSALICALLSAGVGPGDEVIVPAYTWIATVAAVISVGATPVVVDIDKGYTMDPARVGNAVTAATKAVLPVHMRGAAANMRPILDLARDLDLVVIEDACQALGATYRGRFLGTLGTIGCFSLQYGKTITTGEGGLIVTDEPNLYRRALDVHDGANSMRRASRPPELLGWNFRFPEVSAAIGLVQLQRLDGILAASRRNHALARSLLATVDGVTVRPSHDQAGDAGLALILHLDLGIRCQAGISKMRDRGVPVIPLYDAEAPDLHVVAWWTSATDRLGRHNTDAKEGWSATVDLLSRSIQIDLHPAYTEEEVVCLVEIIADACAGATTS